MTFALFLGCKIPYHLSHYGSATKAVLKALEVPWEEMEFNCCGYPIRTFDADAFLFSAARNLALAEAKHLDILTPCKCCFGSLQHAKHWLSMQDSVKDNINHLLDKEGLHFSGTTQVKHLLSLFINDVGLERIRDRINRPFKNLKIAAHYGCHALRPSAVTQFDDPLAPTVFEKLIDVTGAVSIPWQKRLECCGNPLWEKNSELSLRLMNSKISDAKRAGADYLCSACTYCQIQFDTVQQQQAAAKGDNEVLASLLYPQLLGLSLGVDAETLGLNRNKLNITQVQHHQD